MSVRPFLSRVLLSLALVVNAVAPATASTHMQAGHGDSRAAPLAANANGSQANMPCHQVRSAGVAATADAPTPATPTHDRTNQRPPDCCTPGTCDCACVHASQAALPAPTTGIVRILRLPAIDWLPLAHGTPALPDLIRPPIG